ncbi:hypothetical protein [Pseudoroseomonas sp. WGS1072]|uniref:hypothetical protein n=1 Tax=Roseomonas sp. WGS1072 TaxID=3366816 RepID=UPI003BF3A99F
MLALLAWQAALLSDGVASVPQHGGGGWPQALTVLGPELALPIWVGVVAPAGASAGVGSGMQLEVMALMWHWHLPKATR